MDISTTSSASTGMSSDMTQASVTSKTSSAKDSSFKSEMDKVSEKNNSQKEGKIDSEKKSNTRTNNEINQTKEVKTESKDKTTANKKLKSEVLEINNKNFYELNQENIHTNQIYTGAIEYTKDDMDIVNNQMQALIDANIMLKDVVSDARVPVKVDYSVIEMDMNDTQFFTDLVQDADKTLQNVALELTKNIEPQVQEVQKNIKVSATLMNALSNAVKNNQSFRIDFDKDISVIIKVDKDGALSARFIPGDAAVESYLKQNISTLRQRFDDQELSYKELSYTGQQKRERRNNKENSHE